MTARWAILASSALLGACTAAPRIPGIEPVIPAPGCAFVSIDLSSYSVWGFEWRLQVRADGTALLEGRNWYDAEDRDAEQAPRRVGRIDGLLLDLLCSLLDSDSISDLDEQYTDPWVDDAGSGLFVVRFPDDVHSVYVYGDAAPPLLQRLDALLDEVINTTTWERWSGADSSWLARSGWPPLEVWWRGQPVAYPPAHRD